MTEYVPHLIAKRNGQRIWLTKTEREILSLLIKHRNKVVSYALIFREVWQDDYMAANWRAFTACVQHQISNLRRKLEPDARNPRYILTQRGEGYVFVTEEST